MMNERTNERTNEHSHRFNKDADHNDNVVILVVVVILRFRPSHLGSIVRTSRDGDYSIRASHAEGPHPFELFGLESELVFHGVGFRNMVTVVEVLSLSPMPML